MMEYCCGFYFSEDRKRVVLLRASRPWWDGPRLNGVGGKIEPGETPVTAMIREFKEEAGQHVLTWQTFTTTRRADHCWSIVWYRAFGNFLHGFRSPPGGEPLEIRHVAAVVGRTDLAPFVSVMLPLALSFDGLCVPATFDVKPPESECVYA